MIETVTRRLADMTASPIRPMSQSDAKSVLSDLKDIGKQEPAIAALLSTETPLRDFLIKHFERYLLYYLDLPTHVEVLRIWNSARGLAALMEGDA